MKLVITFLILTFSLFTFAEEIILNEGSTITLIPQTVTTITCKASANIVNKCQITSGCQGCHTSLNFVVRNSDGSGIVATRTFEEATNVLQDLVAKNICD